MCKKCSAEQVIIPVQDHITVFMDSRGFCLPIFAEIPPSTTLPVPDLGLTEEGHLLPDTYTNIKMIGMDRIVGTWKRCF